MGQRCRARAAAALGLLAALGAASPGGGPAPAGGAFEVRLEGAEAWRPRRGGGSGVSPGAGAGAGLGGEDGAGESSLGGEGAVSFPSEAPGLGQPVGTLVLAGSAAFYQEAVDACGVCRGDNSSCTGCDGVPLSGRLLDACGECLCAENTAPEGTCTGLDMRWNQSCMDCSGEPNGGREVDVCQLCLRPDDPLFGQACLGCDGIPNSGVEEDGCGVCGGPGCHDKDGEPLPVDERSLCCDCAGEPNGPHNIGLLCECVHNVTARPGQLAPDELAWWNGRPESQSEAISMFEAAAALHTGLQAEAERVSTARQVYLNAPSAELAYPASIDIFNTSREIRRLLKEAWTLLDDYEGSSDNTTAFDEVYRWRNVTNPRDMCGVCDGDNSTCMGCLFTDPVSLAERWEPLPLVGGFLADDCGRCTGQLEDDDDALAALEAGAETPLEADACGVCFGDNSTCLGCDGVPNSGHVLDVCFGSSDPRMQSFGNVPELEPETGEPVEGAPPAGPVLGEVGSGCSDPVNFSIACAAGGGGCCGCDGVPDSGRILDDCGSCVNPESEPELWNKACAGCDGVPFSGMVYDACCQCGGEANRESECYQELFAGGYDPERAAAMGEEPKRTALWSEVFDACGECRDWGYKGRTCAGCDGVPFSGLVVDSCGVCGGSCDCEEFPDCALSELEARTVPVELKIEGGSVAYTPARECYMQLVGGTGVPPESPLPCVPRETFDTFELRNNARPRAAAYVPLCAEPFYTPKNRPGVLQWSDTVKGVCHLWVQPPPDPPPERRNEWVVFVHGREYGPLSMVDMMAGSIEVQDSVSFERIPFALTPETPVGRVVQRPEQRTLEYGQTSVTSDTAAFRANKYRRAAELQGHDLLSVRDAPNVEQEVVVRNKGTVVVSDVGADGGGGDRSGGGSYLPLGSIPELLGVVFPSCTGSTFRKKHRLHGRKTGGNYLGLLVDEGVEWEDGSLDRPWNPDRERIYDAPESPTDARCECRRSWTYGPDPVPPTCEREWRDWKAWMDPYIFQESPRDRVEGAEAVTRPHPAGRAPHAPDGTYTVMRGGTRYFGRYPDPDVPLTDIYTESNQRSLFERGGSSFLGQGGMWRQDFGGSLMFTGAHPTPVAAVPTRGPWRVGSSGGFTHESLFSPPDPDRDRCYAAVRLTEPRKGETAAVWWDTPQRATGTWSAEVEFQITDRSQRCVRRERVSRAFSEEVRTRTHETCSASAGDGLALVLLDRDATDSVYNLTGEGQGGLGYAGLRGALVVEIDTFSDDWDPAGTHVAVHTQGRGTVSADHTNALCDTREGLPDVADGRRHVLRVSHRRLSPGQLQEVLELGSIRASSGLGKNIGASIGALDIFIDDLQTPVLTTLIDVRTVLRAASTFAWFGVTASTGSAGFQIVDLFGFKVEGPP